MTIIQSLNTLHELPGLAQVLPGQGDLPKIHITTPAANAEIYLHGAQITSWQPAGQEEVLFTSRQSKFADGKAIRGGIPICFPWFRAKSDNPTAPAHGFVRTKSWNLDSIAQQDENIVVTLSTESDGQTRQWWPNEFRLVHRLTIGAQLKLELITTNTGTAPFQIEEALHTYHRIGSIHTARVTGLDGIAYLDNRDNNVQKLQSGEIQLTQATDNAYLDPAGPLSISDATLRRRIHIAKQGSGTTIVWNPWQDGAAVLPDLGDDEWQQFICVEAGNILASSVTVAPGEQHTLTATLSVMP